MRLIDVDTYLKKVCTYNETGCGSCKLQTFCPLDEQIIMEAIPVEWLKEQYKIEGYYGTDEYFRKAYAVKEIIADWVDWQAEQMEEDEQRYYEASVEMAEHCEMYEPTYNREDGSM